MDMTGYVAMKILTIAGSTFAMGLAIGWTLALLHLSGFSSSSHKNKDDED